MRTLPVSILLFVIGSGLHPLSMYAAPTSKALSMQTTEFSFSSFTGEIKGNRVRLRLAPNVDSHIIKELSKGDLVAVIGENKDYYMISAPEGMTGYVFRTFVLDNVIEGEQVNVRLGPSTSSPVLAQLSKGTHIQTTDTPTQGKWVEIYLPTQCVFYIAKNFVINKGSVDLYKQREGQKKVALDLLNSAIEFAKAELKKDLHSVDLESIYKKINLIQSEEFRDIPGLSDLAQKALEEVQNIYLEKSLNQNNNTTPAEASPSAATPTEKPSHSLLSQCIRKQSKITTAPKIEGRESFEYALFKVWSNMQAQDQHIQPTIEAFYAEERKKQQILVGEVLPYPYIVKNNPGDYILKDKERVIAFIYGTKIDLAQWVGKKVSVECLPRPNNHFAFPAYYVIGIKEIA